MRKDRPRLGVLLFGASVALCWGITLYLSVRSEEGDTYVHAQFIVAAFLLCSLALNLMLAWDHGRWGGVPRFILRLILSLLATAAGAVCVFAVEVMINRLRR